MGYEDLKEKLLQDRHDYQIEIRRKLDSLKLERSETSAKINDLILHSQREEMQPHKRYCATVYFDTSENKYACRLVNYVGFDLEDDDEDFSPPEDIVAYGDTPQQACDNFDYLWVHGK